MLTIDQLQNDPPCSHLSPAEWLRRVHAFASSPEGSAIMAEPPQKFDRPEDPDARLAAYEAWAESAAGRSYTLRDAVRDAESGAADRTRIADRVEQVFLASVHCPSLADWWAIPTHGERIPQTTFARFEARHRGQADALEASKQWSASDGRMLVLCGPVGSGKSHLAVACGAMAVRREVLAQPISFAREWARFSTGVAYESTPELLARLNPAAYSNENREVPLRLMRETQAVPFLILDDMGTRSASPAQLEYLYRILDARLRDTTKRTVVTSNHSTVDAVLGAQRADPVTAERLMSRVHNVATFVAAGGMPRRDGGGWERTYPDQRIEGASA